MLAVALLFTGAGYGSALASRPAPRLRIRSWWTASRVSLQHGRFFVFFFDPECSHCNDAGRHMGTYHWKSDVTIVGVPTRMQQFGVPFMNDNHLKALVSTDLAKLKAAFPMPGDPPYGVEIENGRQVGVVQHYDDEDTGKEPAATLRQLGLID